MPVNVYESLIMLDTSKVAGDLPAAQQQLHAIMERNKVEVLASRPWDERRLVYPIRGQKKGAILPDLLQEHRRAPGWHRA